MVTNIIPLEELKEIFVETMLNKTDKVTKITDGSVLNGIAYGTAKIGQKILKDVAIIESHLFPDSAYGVYLDNLAKLKGVSARRGATKSSVYIRVFGSPGTNYISGIHKFMGNNGVIFDIETTTTIPNFGYTYIKCKSQNLGSNQNIEPLSINKVAPIPTGHEYCINEYAAVGGYDNESDELFRQRIKTEINVYARETLAYIEQVFMKINPRVLRVLNYGFNQSGDCKLAIITVDGTDLTLPELDELLVKGEKYFSISEMRPYNNNHIGIELTNIVWQPIDISFRVDLDNNYDVDEVRKRIQVNLNKELDYRYWKYGKKVEWDNLLEIVKRTEGVRYVTDNNFFPNKDIVVEYNKLPRIRGFQMLDLEGNLIIDFVGNLNEVYYPNNIDFIYQADLLQSI